ncbi:MAG: hypothetical protein ACPGJS_05840 [Flammeovirgaceae bacterium]
MNYYQGFGLTFASELALPELMPLSTTQKAQVDVHISLGETPQKLAGNQVVARAGNWVSPTAYLLERPNLARYYAHEGNRMVVEPLISKPNWRNVRLYLLQTMCIAILHQRKQLPLKVKAIQKHGKVTLFASLDYKLNQALTDYFVQHQIHLLSDNYGVIDPDQLQQGQCAVYGSYPVFTTSKAMASGEKLKEDLDIYLHPFHQQFTSSALPVEQIILLNSMSKSGLHTKQVKQPVQQMTLLQTCIAHEGMLQAMGGNQHCFTALTKLLHTKVPIYEIAIPPNYSVTSLMQLINESYF